MPTPSPSPLAADIAAAIDWWREAGVDAEFVDEPRAWLADPEADKPAPVVAKAPDEQVPFALEPEIGGPREAWPQDLAAFQRWWLAEPSLDEGGLAPRIAPSGEAAADLMILVPMPEESDTERLLSGRQGKLIDGFLSAAGIAPDKAYRASVLPRHTPLADWAQVERQGMGAVLARHVALVRPRRLIALGRNILPLCGHDPAQGAQKLGSFNHEDGRVPTLFVAGPDRLLDNPQLRARLWQHWLDWTETDAWREAER